MKPPILLFLLIGLLLVGCQNQEKKTLRIAAAANLQFAIKELTSTFTTQTKIPCDVIIGSSGKLTAQIKEGAPYDLFLSADMKFPTAIYDAGLSKAPPGILAYGKLILWSPLQNIHLDSLQSPWVKHIAIANPKVAPYGIAATEVLQNYGIFEQVKEKLVYGESIAQVNQFVDTGVAEAGFTALSVAMAFDNERTGYWVALDKESYTPIAQGIVLLENKRGMEKEARLFYDFLFSEEGRRILAVYGYEGTSSLIY